jgi:hypothetical protein
MLHLDVKVGQWVEIPGVGRLFVGHKSGRIVKLGFEFAKDQKITLVPLTGDGERHIEKALLPSS